MKFTLEIELGNDAMQSPQDIVDAFMRLSDHFQGDTDPWIAPNSGRVVDGNGNSVGKWQVTA